jgi:hypothetical protein
MLLLGPMTNLMSLKQVMLLLVPAPYAINAVFWFVFYKFFPSDVRNLKARLAAQAVD